MFSTVQSSSMVTVCRYLGHSHIIQAISDRDGELAEMLMRRHIAASRKNIEQKIALQLTAEVNK